MEDQNRILKELLMDLADWRGAYDDDPIAATLRAEELFFKETGMFAPGRSAPVGYSHVEYDVRVEKWRKWCVEKNNKLNERIREAIDRL